MARAALPSPPALYDTDFVAWTAAQARELRRLADALPPSLDVAHLAEEIEDLGRSERDAVRSQVRRLIERLLKLAYAGDRRPERQRRLSVDEARDVLADKLTPSLLRDLELEFARLYRRGRRRAVRSLVELDGRQADRLLPGSAPFRLDQILDESWYPTGPGGTVPPPRQPARRP